MNYADRLRQIADTQNVRLFTVICDDLRAAADLIEQLEADLERTRQAWVDGEDPLCEDVCRVACKGPCGVAT